MSLVFDEYGRPFIILREQGKKSRVKGVGATKANIAAAKCVGKILRTSLGPKGMDKMLQDSNGDLTVTNDGATILERMELDNQIGKLLVELSRSQDYEIGDGTTGVTILAASLLEMAEPLIDMGIHPLRVAEGYEVGCRIAMANLDKIAQKFVFRESDVEPMVRACMTALSSKIVGRCQRSLAEVCGWAVLAVADLQRRDINLELIKVEGKLGGGLGDTTLVNGIVVEKEMAHPQMQKWVSNARIAILTCPFEPPKPKTKHLVGKNSIKPLMTNEN
jgi:T-complex protein 1 subunit epsilon